MLKALCVCVVQGGGSSSWSLCQDPSHLSPVLHKGSSAICQESYQLITYSSECKRLVLPGSVNNLKFTPQCLLQVSTTNFHALKVVVMLLCFASFSSGIFCKKLFFFFHLRNSCTRTMQLHMCRWMVATPVPGAMYRYVAPTAHQDPCISRYNKYMLTVSRIRIIWPDPTTVLSSENCL